MTDGYDQATLMLLADLEAAPPSPKRDAIIERARAFKYHDYHPNGYTTPQLALYDHLQKAGLSELAANVKLGKYDQDFEESRKWIESEEGQEVAKQFTKPPPGVTPNPDTDDQRRLRALGRDLDEQMRAAGAGGVVILSSRESSSWTISLPNWGGLQPDILTGQLRLRINSKTPEARAIADATLGYIADVRDIAGEIATVFSGLFEQAERALKAQGADIDHQPIGSPGKVGPTGKLKH